MRSAFFFTLARDGPVIGKLLALALIWVAWCSLHSGLITPGAVAWFRRRLGGYFAFFRLGYNLVAIFALIPVLMWSEAMPYRPLIVWRWPYAMLVGVMWLTAAWLAVGGARAYTLGEFSGLTQIRRWRPGKGEAPGTRPLSRAGILGTARHPWYLTGFIILWARNLAPQDLVASVVLSIYLVLGAHWEERKLVAEFGEAYRQYQRQVPMFLPLPRRFRSR